MERTLLITDIEGSTALAERLGDAAAAALWAAHDRVARELLARHNGREIDRSDGFFLLFGPVDDAAAFALGYHAAMQPLGLAARVGIHRGAVSEHHNPPEAVALGAKPVEVEGLAKPVAARVMSLARGGQTLLSAPARRALGVLPEGAQVQGQGHWRAKGISEPIELFELGPAGSAFVPPADGEKVYRVVRSGDLWRPLREVPHNLAPERDAFVGRGGELRALAQGFESGQRLISVIGVGGTGKTRLVRRYGVTWLGDWPGGVHFCDLSEARTLEGILFAVALALGVSLGKGDAAVQLGHAIDARGRCLLILDNFEQVLPHAAATVGAWLDRAADACFLVTSRERLHLTGETVFAAEPLALHSEAIELFAVRARAQRPDFELDVANRLHVAEIVRVLDGLPLAVELAAARVRVLSPAQIVQRLRDRFTLLIGARGAAARQATLRGAIDWSWELLNPQEQAALAQCSVFEGGFTLEAAEQVLDLSAFDQAPPAIDVVQSLLDKSLLRAWVPDAAARLDIAEPLFGMYLTIHEYASERLARAAVGAREATEQRHGRHFAQHGSSQAIDALSRAGGVQRRRVLLLELDNLVAACRRALQRTDAAVAVPSFRAAWEVLVLRGPFAAGLELGHAVLALTGLEAPAWLDAASSLADAMLRSGRLNEARVLLERMAERARDAGDTGREGQALGQLGNLLREQGLMDEARGCMEAALPLHESAGNHLARASVLHNLGNLLDQVGEPEPSRASHEAALALHQASGNRHGEGHVRASLGILNRHQGRLQEALEQYQAARLILREVGDRRSEGILIGNMANIYGDLGDETRQLSFLEESLAVNREVGSRIFEAYVLANLGLAQKQQKRWQEARECMLMALAIDREVNNRIHEGVVLTNLGSLQLSLGDHAAALEYFQVALQRHRETSDRLYVGMTLALLGETLREQRQTQAALTALDEGEAVLRVIDNPVELGSLLCIKGKVRHDQGNLSAAQSLLEEVQRIAQPLGAGSRLDAAIASLKEAMGRTSA